MSGTNPWIERVRAADAEAEARTRWADEVRMEHGVFEKGCAEAVSALALIAIAAELRAARIARRPGAGQ